MRFLDRDECVSSQFRDSLKLTSPFQFPGRSRLFLAPFVINFLVFLFYGCPCHFVRRFFARSVAPALIGVLVLIPGIIESGSIYFLSMLRQYIGNVVWK